MKKILYIAIALWLTVVSCSQATVLVEAESFDSPGGWVIDQQSMDVLGSPYLLAHGLGTPVEDATTVVTLPEPGRYHCYVRTFNWTAPWWDGEGPGAFSLSGGPVCGTKGKEWGWQYAGSVVADSLQVELKLHDLTGFDGRCDAVYLSRRRIPAWRLPSYAEGMEKLRREMIPGYDTPKEEGPYDLVVVGGGVSGMCAAVSAARLGQRVALIHDRPVLGGNNSSEVRIHLSGIIGKGPYPNLGNLIKEFGHEKCSNAAPAEAWKDVLKKSFVTAEPLLTLYSPYHAIRVEASRGQHISSVYARDIRTGALIRVSGRLFADCTGDGTIGYLSGAEWMEGRESSAEYGEKMSPKEPDNMKNGVSMLWTSVDEGSPQPFPEFDYGCGIDSSNVYNVTKANWSWETGLEADMTEDIEQVRDYLLLMTYGNWSWLKNHSADSVKFRNRRMDHLPYIAGKRESRRLKGDLVLTENDIIGQVMYPDGTACATWSIDLHRYTEENSAKFPGREFRTVADHEYYDPYPIPYRCLYSCNVDNLFMAGRDVSATHVALGAVRVLRTCAMMGEVVGMAASVCSQRDCSPRMVYTQYFDDLKALMLEGTGRKDLPNNQDFANHGCFPPPARP